jgi:hypothetical protein
VNRTGRAISILSCGALAAACGVLVAELDDALAVAVVLLGVVGFATALLIMRRRSSGERRRSAGGPVLVPTPPWWLHPAWMIPLAGLPSLILADRIPESVFRANWNTPKYFGDEQLAMGMIVLAGFSAGALVATLWWGHRGRQGPRAGALSPAQILRLGLAVRVLFVVTLLGYAAQLIFAGTRGLDMTDVVAVFTGANPVGDVKREYLRPVAGVTTLTQFGPLAVAGLMLLRRLDPGFPSARYIATLIVLGAFRSVLYAERLALLELLVPLAVIALAFPRTDALRRTRARKAALAIAPLWLPVALLLVFGAFEYVRSWSSYYADANPGSSYPAFVVDRLGAYYATASNNSALLIEHDPRPSRVPYGTAEWLWNLPLLERAVPYERFAGVDFPGAYESLLLRLGNPEFNNPGGILFPVFDLGPLPGLLFWIALGVVLTLAYRRFIALEASGLVIFPVLFIGCLEVGRLLHWTLGRAFPALAGAIVLGLWLDHAARPQVVRSSSRASPAIGATEG